MSWSPCPLCFAPLEGHDGSPCTNPRCFNSQRVRERRASAVIAPLTGQVTPQRPDDELRRRERKARRRAAKLARRRNRKARR